MTIPAAPDEPDDAALASALARAAGRAVLDLRAQFGPVADDLARRALMDAGDARAQQLISDGLAAARPGDAVLSEEAPDSEARLVADRVWIIDPLDGTEEYGLGRSDFAIHVALWQRVQPASSPGPAGGPTPAGDPATGNPVGALIAAAVDLPALGETWRTDVPGRPGPLPRDRPLRIVVSRTRPPAALPGLVAAASAELAARGITHHGIVGVNVGSVGAKVGEVMAGRAEAYLHPGGLNEWDLAAPHACALARGLVAMGPPQAFNRMPPRSGPVLICHPDLAEVLATHWR